MTSTQSKLLKYQNSKTVVHLDLELARTPISVLGGEGSNAWSTDWELKNGYSKAGQVQTPNTCYRSAFCQDAYANLDITPSSVTHVKLLNQADGAGKYHKYTDNEGMTKFFIVRIKLDTVMVVDSVKRDFLVT